MGLIILSIGISITFAFLSGIVAAATSSSDNDNDYSTFLTIVATIFLIISVGVSVGTAHSYVESKEYSSTEYSLKKKVITIEEDSTVKLDTIYTFINKK